MSMKYLGDRFDIHAGGNDLRFPHHEDEIAQSEGAVGHEVVSIWVHAGHLRQSGQKIAKSTGNVVRVPDLIERGFDPLAFRWLCFQTQYRSEMDFTWEAMEAADQRVAPAPATDGRAGRPGRPSSATPRRASTPGSARRSRTTCTCPSAVVVVNELVVLDRGPRRREVRAARLVGPRAGARSRAGGHARTWEPTAAMRALMAERDAARAAKDFATATDARRLAAMGLEVMDTAEGTRVRPRRQR